jgi:hypothetical protein
MRLENYQLFAQLCESYIEEASTSLDMVKGHPGAQEVIQRLHTQMGLSHDQQYGPVAKISWSELKDSYRGSWVLIKGDKGTGAIKANGRDYEAVASAGGETTAFRDGRGGNVVDFLKGKIGGLRSFYVGKNTNAVKDKQTKRQGQKANVGPSAVNQGTLVKKFRPLWVKAMTAATADIKGHISNQIKNDAFEKAKRKLTQLEQLQNALSALERGDTEDVPSFVNKAVQDSILMAAAHYYPDETGEIRRSYGSGNTSTHDAGPQKLLADISQGDTSKLGTILAFFKRNLISG